MPVLAKEEVIAVLAFYMYESRKEDKHLVEFIVSVASQLGLVIKQKKTEDLIRKQEENLKKIIDYDPIGSIIVDKQGKVCFVNHTLKLLLGWDIGGEKNIIGNYFGLPMYAEEVTEIEILARDKTVHVFEICFVSFKWNGENARLVRLVDITKRKKAEDELAKFSTVIVQSANLVLITGIKGNIEYVNPMFEKVTGYTKDELFGKTPKMLSSGETPREEYENL